MGTAFEQTAAGDSALVTETYVQTRFEVFALQLLQQVTNGFGRPIPLRIDGAPRKHLPDCGANDPRVLEFDHRDPNTKLDHVTSLARRGAAWARIEAEIAKCDIRCANCHRRRTAAQFNWPKLALSAIDRGGHEQTRTGAYPSASEATGGQLL